MDHRVNASCPECGEERFSIFDMTPDGDYPRIMYKCLKCGQESNLQDLRGLDLHDVMPF